MGQAPKELTPTASPLHFFGAQLRELRETAGLSQAELGRVTLNSADLVRKIETAERAASRQFVDRCDEVLCGGGMLRRLWPLLERERELRSTIADQRDHGTLGPSARAEDRLVLDWLLAHNAGDVGPEPPQLDLATHAAERLMRFREVDHLQGAGRTYPEVADVVRRDLQKLSQTAPSVAIGYLELAGYEAVDLGADTQARGHYLRALEITTRTGNRLYGGYLIGVSLAHLALHGGDARHAIRLVNAGLRGVADCATPAVRAAIQVVAARAHARLGDERASAAALHQVDVDLDRSRPAEEPEWIGYFGPADLADEKAHCFFDLGLHDRAQDEAATAIGLLHPSRMRRLAIDSSLHATSLARSGDLDRACAVAHEAIDYTAGTTSFRSAHRVTMMLAELHPHATIPSVREVNDYARTVLADAPVSLADLPG
ncbi:helix-turn-helix domain-containing protein [Phytomonospora endophytica]|uniref:Transcriptional regulator with XRE-family HTH domain n=1 Tax=Phytomonospora endophytica TaxID=714109 RepID=A0A841FNJ5_9ACTN|nr:helix-turn-helix transcriptional regulator [Phytomonospora endophytica]MBB6037676.1 transcriptional regulator with XRE-family HTH domain [Phytomonospora endophytica]GIG67798.1 hypothetical protein Pen01_40930 [Phytomonospora endophytica]